jgi:hypothetical protein
VGIAAFVGRGFAWRVAAAVQAKAGEQDGGLQARVLDLLALSLAHDANHMRRIERVDELVRHLAFGAPAVPGEGVAAVGELGGLQIEARDGSAGVRLAGDLQARVLDPAGEVAPVVLDLAHLAFTGLADVSAFEDLTAWGELRSHGHEPNAHVEGDHDPMAKVGRQREPGG